VHFLVGLSALQLILALVVVMAAGVLIEITVRARLHSPGSRGDGAVANYVQMLTVFYGLLLGLVAIDLWQKQDAAEVNTIVETDRIRILLALAGHLPGDQQAVLNSLGDYAQSVVKKEWPIMLAEKSEELFVASPELDTVRDTIMDLEPKSQVEQAAFQEMISSYDQIVEARQRRLLDSQRHLPPVLWIVLILGAVFTWLGTWLIPSDQKWSQLALSSVTCGYLFLLMYLILVLEHPFLGSWRVDPAGYQRLLEILH
jgi:hypothetical protein